MKKIVNIDSAVFHFVEAASRHGEASKLGDYKIANKNYDVIIACLKYLKEQNALLSLAKFFNDPYTDASLWAATYLLPMKEYEATEVLNNIGKGQGIQSLNARTVLKEWENGTLKLFFGENTRL